MKLKFAQWHVVAKKDLSWLNQRINHGINIFNQLIATCSTRDLKWSLHRSLFKWGLYVLSTCVLGNEWTVTWFCLNQMVIWDIFASIKWLKTIKMALWTWQNQQLFKNQLLKTFSWFCGVTKKSSASILVSTTEMLVFHWANAEENLPLCWPFLNPALGTLPLSSPLWQRGL